MAVALGARSATPTAPDAGTESGQGELEHLGQVVEHGAIALRRELPQLAVGHTHQGVQLGLRFRPGSRSRTLHARRVGRNPQGGGRPHEALPVAVYQQWQRQPLHQIHPRRGFPGRPACRIFASSSTGRGPSHSASHAFGTDQC